MGSSKPPKVAVPCLGGQDLDMRLETVRAGMGKSPKIRKRRKIGELLVSEGAQHADPDPKKPKFGSRTLRAQSWGGPEPPFSVPGPKKGEVQPPKRGTTGPQNALGGPKRDFGVSWGGQREAGAAPPQQGTRDG